MGVKQEQPAGGTDSPVQETTIERLTPKTHFSEAQKQAWPVILIPMGDRKESMLPVEGRINGVFFRIPRGKPVRVHPSVREILLNAIEDRAVNEIDPANPAYITTKFVPSQRIFFQDLPKGTPCELDMVEDVRGVEQIRKSSREAGAPLRV